MRCLLLALSIFLCTSCANHKVTQNSIPIKEHTVLAVLWQQNAAEYRALCYQAFNTARSELNNIVRKISVSKPLAIITDLDETILDNSPYSVELIDQDSNYNKETWNNWGRKEAATLVPGAAEFLNDVQNMGIEVFYVSNRGVEQTEETLNNLRKYNLPNVDESHLYLKSGVSSKTVRRSTISNTHEVVMLLGDNLSDFDEIFEDESTAKRNQLVNENSALFGKKFIVFPNPMYGDWENDGIYDGKRYEEYKKNQVRKDKLKR